MVERPVISMYNIVSFFGEYTFQLQKGEYYVSCGNVVRTHFDPDVHPYLLKGEVKSSATNRVYSVEISLDVDDGIVAASCSCPRPQLVCHHMAALCIIGHDNFRLKDMPSSRNVLEESCEKDEVLSFEQLFPKTKKNYCAVGRMPTEEETATFLKAVKESGCMWFHEPESEDSDASSN